MKDTPGVNPSQLGDPVSLRAEKSPDSEPTEQDRPNKGQTSGRGTLKELAESKLQTNPTQLGDPISLKAETSETEPTEQDRGAQSDPEAVAKDRKARDLNVKSKM